MLKMTSGLMGLGLDLEQISIKQISKLMLKITMKMELQKLIFYLVTYRQKRCFLWR